MSKGAVIAAVVVGGVVILGGAALAMASGKPSYPNLAPPPPPPPQDSLGRFIVREGYAALDEFGHSNVVTTYTGGEKAGSYIAKNLATGGLYGTVKGGVNLAKKAWNSIF